MIMESINLIKVHGYDQDYDCELVKGTYFYNKSLALGFVDIVENQLYGIFTKCLEGAPLSDEYCAFVDTNNWDDIIKLITQNNLGEPTGKFCRSGHCIYPEFRFRKEIVDSIRFIE